MQPFAAVHPKPREPLREAGGAEHEGRGDRRARQTESHALQEMEKERHPHQASEYGSMWHMVSGPDRRARDRATMPRLPCRRRHDRVDGPAGQPAVGWRVDHERGHVDRPHRACRASRADRSICVDPSRRSQGGCAAASRCWPRAGFRLGRRGLTPLGQLPRKPGPSDRFSALPAGESASRFIDLTSTACGCTFSKPASRRPAAEAVLIDPRLSRAGIAGAA